MKTLAGRGSGRRSGSPVHSEDGGDRLGRQVEQASGEDAKVEDRGDRNDKRRETWSEHLSRRGRGLLRHVHHDDQPSI